MTRRARFSCLVLLLGLVAAVVFKLWFWPEPNSNIYEARRHSQDYSISPVSFRTMDAFFPTQTVATTPGEPLPVALKQLDFKTELSGALQSFEEGLKKTDTNAILVIHKGNIVYERYFNGADETSRFVSWSMSKSLISILIGTALEAGHIKSIDDTVDTYVSALKGTAFEGVSIRNMLSMRAATSYRERNFPLLGRSDLDLLIEKSLYQNEIHFTDFKMLDLKREHAPGETFNYSTLTSSLLGRVLEEATGKTLAEYTEQAVWKPSGMQSSAYWLLDGAPPRGRAFGGGGFNATLRDYGRLGLMMLQDGMIGGKKIVSKDWVNLSTQYKSLEPVLAKTPRGYKYHWWTLVGTEIFEAVGIHGQYISVDPKTETVIIKASYWPSRGGGKYFLEHIALFDAIRTAVVKE